MEQTQASTRPRIFRDLGTEARIQVFDSLDNELRKPAAMTHLRLSDWVGSSDDRRALVAGHYTDRGTWVVVPSQSVWDATTADSDYRVAFVFFAGVGFLYSNRLTVSLASVAWDMGVIAGPGYLTLEPFRYSEFASRGERIVFPDYIVRHLPFRRGGQIQPLGPARDTERFKEPVTQPPVD